MISEVCQGLNPHVTVDGLILQDKGLSLANFEHFSGIFLLDVKVEKFVLQIFVRLAAVDNAILRAIDLKQEQHVMLIDFVAIVTLNEVIYRHLNLR